MQSQLIVYVLRLKEEGPMQLPDSIETHGSFWQAGEPERRMTGILRISATGDSFLEMFGALASDHQSPLHQPNGESLHILGVTDQSGPVTLTNCVVVEQSHTVNINFFCKSRIHVTHVFWGAHFHTPEVVFKHMTFSVEGLDEWFAFHYRPFSSDGDPTGPMSIAYDEPESITFPIADDLHIGFHMRAEVTSSLFEESISTEMSISLASSRLRPFSEFMQVLRKVKDFICLALDRIVAFTSISGSRSTPNAPYTPQDTVIIYGTFDPYDRAREDISVGHMLISFHDISHKIQEYLPRWLEHYDDYAPTFDLYFTVSANRHMHLEGKFLFLVHGIESLHRRSSSETRMAADEFDNVIGEILESTPDRWRCWIKDKLTYANELSFRIRIRQMVSLFSDLFGPASARKSFVNQVVNTRNYLTHYDNRIKDRAVTDPEELLQLYFRLEALVQLHLLRLSGIDHADITTMARQYPPLQRKLVVE